MFGSLRVFVCMCVYVSERKMGGFTGTYDVFPEVAHFSRELTLTTSQYNKTLGLRMSNENANYMYFN